MLDHVFGVLFRIADGGEQARLRLFGMAKQNRSRIASAALLACGLLLPAPARVNASSPDGFKPQDRAHWAFQPAVQPPIPQVRNSTWARRQIHAFVLTQLEAHTLPPGPMAAKATLLRRASLDLIGLPPTPDELDEFLADESSGAFARVVERLLASPHYGERWARHWLDLARFAE